MNIERAIAIKQMYRAIRGGVSFNAFYRWAREEKLSYGRNTMLADWHSVEAELSLQDFWIDKPRDYVPKPGEFVEVTWELKSEYLTPVRFQRYDYVQKKWVDDYVSIAHDRPMSLDELLESAGELVALVATSGGFRTRAIQILATKHRAGE